MRAVANVVVLSVSIFTLLGTSALGEGDPTSARRSIMKNVAAAGGLAYRMAIGKIDYNAQSAELALRTLNTAALALPELFPDGSQPKEDPAFKLDDGDGVAKSTIWENKEGFRAAAAKFAADSEAAIGANKQGFDSFKESFKAVGSNCGSCHGEFRIKLK